MGTSKNAKNIFSSGSSKIKNKLKKIQSGIDTANKAIKAIKSTPREISRYIRSKHSTLNASIKTQHTNLNKVVKSLGGDLKRTIRTIPDIIMKKAGYRKLPAGMDAMQKLAQTQIFSQANTLVTALNNFTGTSNSQKLPMDAMVFKEAGEVYRSADKIAKVVTKHVDIDSLTDRAESLTQISYFFATKAKRAAKSSHFSSKASLTKAIHELLNNFMDFRTKTGLDKMIILPPALEDMDDILLDHVPNEFFSLLAALIPSNILNTIAYNLQDLTKVWPEWLNADPQQKSTTQSRSTTQEKSRLRTTKRQSKAKNADSDFDAETQKTLALVTVLIEQLLHIVSIADELVQTVSEIAPEQIQTGVGFGGQVDAGGLGGAAAVINASGQATGGAKAGLKLAIGKLNISKAIFGILHILLALIEWALQAANSAVDYNRTTPADVMAYLTKAK